MTCYRQAEITHSHLRNLFPFQPSASMGIPDAHGGTSHIIVSNSETVQVLGSLLSHNLVMYREQ